MSERGDSVKQNKNYAHQERDAEASLISFAGRREEEGQSACFRSCALDASDTAGACVGHATTRGVVEGFKNEKNFEIWPFLSFPVTPRTVTRPAFGERGFRPVPVHAREGGYLASFASLSMQLQSRAGSLQQHIHEHVVQTSLASPAVTTKCREYLK